MNSILFFFSFNKRYWIKRTIISIAKANRSHPVPTCLHCTRPRCPGLAMFVHSLAMTQIKAHLMENNIATNCSQLTVPVLAVEQRNPLATTLSWNFPFRSSITQCLPRTYPMRNRSISAHNCNSNCARLVGSNVNKMPIWYGFWGSLIFDLVWCEHGLEHLFKKLLNFLRWPITVTANLPQQVQTYHGKFKFGGPQLSRQIKFSTASWNSLWQI